MWARKMCGEGCVNIVFLVLTHIVDSCAHACASTRPHSLLSSSGRNWIWWRDGAVQIVQAPHQSRSFYRVLWKLHLIPAHSLSVSSWQVWFAHFVKSEHATIGYWKSWVNTLCVISEWVKTPTVLYYAAVRYPYRWYSEYCSVWSINLNILVSLKV